MKTWSFTSSAPPAARARLDAIVVGLLAEAGEPASRATVQRWIERGRVLVDGAPAQASTRVPVGARIDVDPEPPPPSDAQPDASIPLSVVFEDAHLLVIDKPAGLVVHPARGHLSGTLVNALLARGGFERLAADPRDPAGHLRPGIVHRLDKGTSGLLVVAKTEAARERLKAQFAKHTIEREYLALVVGRGRDATYDTLHARHPTDRLRFTSRCERVEKARRAVTHVRVVEDLEGATLVACRLETGRTHQIRVHLAEQGGTPILADTLYGKALASGRPAASGARGRPAASGARGRRAVSGASNPEARLQRAADAIGRPALHARILGFTHPATGKPVRWESPLPDDFASCLAMLRSGR